MWQKHVTLKRWDSVFLLFPSFFITISSNLHRDNISCMYVDTHVYSHLSDTWVTSDTAVSTVIYYNYTTFLYLFDETSHGLP